MVLSERHVAFISEMERFKRVEPQYEDDALPLVDNFLSRVQRVADSITQILLRSTSRDINYAKATFHSFYTKLDGNEPFSLEDDETPNGQIDDRAYSTSYQAPTKNTTKGKMNSQRPTCRGLGCKNIINSDTMRRLNLTEVGIGTL